MGRGGLGGGKRLCREFARFDEKSGQLENRGLVKGLVRGVVGDSQTLVQCVCVCACVCVCDMSGLALVEYHRNRRASLVSMPDEAHINEHTRRRAVVN